MHAALSALRLRHEITLVTVAGPDRRELDAIEHLRASGLNVIAAARAQPGIGGRMLRYARHSAEWLAGDLPMRTIWFRDDRVQRMLTDLLSRARFDVIHVEDNAMGAYRLPPVAPTLLVEHEVRRARPPHWLDVVSRRPLRTMLDELDWQRWDGYQRAVWRRFERVQVFSDRDADRLRSIEPSLAARVRVNTFGIVPPPAGSLDYSREEADHLVFVGQFLHQPNVDAARWLVREILPRLRRRHAGVKLSIVGEDPQRLIRDLAGDGVTLHGWVADLAAVVERAAVVVAPVRTGGGVRMKVMEAMAFAKAVVSTSRGASGLCADAEEPPLALADDADTFAERTSELLDAPAARRELGQRARRFVERHHTADRYGARIEAIYDELVGEWAGRAPATPA
jgi:glycosyltransferase involved in cell wall biosynthesis